MSDIGKTVYAIQGNSIKREILGSDQDGYVLTWVNGNGQWQSAPLPSAGPAFSAGGDLTGTSSDQTVVQITGPAPVGGGIAIGINNGSNIAFFSALGTGSVVWQVQNGGNLVLQAGENTTPGDVQINTYHNIQLNGGNVTLGFNNQLSVITSQVKFGASIQRHTAGGSGTTTYNVALGDDIVFMDTTSALSTATLPATSSAGDTYTITDWGGNAGTNNITVSGNGNNINGNPSFAIAVNYGSAVCVSDGTNWIVLS